MYFNVIFEKDDNHIDVVKKGKRKPKECIFHNWEGVRVERCYNKKSIKVEIFDENFPNDIYERKKGGYWSRVRFFDYLDLCRDVDIFQHGRDIFTYSMRCFLSWEYDTKGNWIEKLDYRFFIQKVLFLLLQKKKL